MRVGIIVDCFGSNEIKQIGVMFSPKRWFEGEYNEQHDAKTPNINSFVVAILTRVNDYFGRFLFINCNSFMSLFMELI